MKALLGSKFGLTSDTVRSQTLWIINELINSRVKDVEGLLLDVFRHCIGAAVYTPLRVAQECR